MAVPVSLGSFLVQYLSLVNIVIGPMTDSVRNTSTSSEKRALGGHASHLILDARR